MAATDRLAYSIREAAETLGISQGLMKEEIYQGRITAIKIGRRTVVPRWALEERLQTPTPVEEWLTELERR